MIIFAAFIQNAPKNDQQEKKKEASMPQKRDSLHEAGAGWRTARCLNTHDRDFLQKGCQVVKTPMYTGVATSKRLS